ncbi:hypothetical protein BHO_0900010 [Borrelia hermsii YBT]|nr:hypothetical protein BHO_0900010 [Borrelia hermsii YBT]
MRPLSTTFFIIEFSKNGVMIEGNKERIVIFILRDLIP